MTKNLSSSLTVLAAAIVLAAFSYVGFAYANPFFRASSAQTSTASVSTLGATSTKTYMTPGTATSTPVYDSFEVNGTNQRNTGDSTVPNSVAIVLDGVASSTSTTVNVTCEFSDNWNGTNGDWYQNEIITATSSPQQTINTPASYTFVGVSSSVGGALVGSLRFQKLVQCPVPLRYARAVISVTGANASMWSAIVPLKQTH